MGKISMDKNKVSKAKYKMHQLYGFVVIGDKLYYVFYNEADQVAEAVQISDENPDIIICQEEDELEAELNNRRAFPVDVFIDIEED